MKNNFLKKINSSIKGQATEDNQTSSNTSTSTTKKMRYFFYYACFFILIILICPVIIFNSFLNKTPNYTVVKGDEISVYNDSVVFPSLPKLAFIVYDFSNDNNGSLSFTVQDDYTTKSDFVLKYNTQIINAVDGVYTIINVNSEGEVSLEGRYTDEYSISGNNLPVGVRVVPDADVFYGEDASFKVNLEDGYSNSNITVKIDNVVITPNSDGYYKVSNVLSNLLVSVSGVELNSYGVNYLAGENGNITGTTSQTISHGEMGTTITAVPNEHYKFSSWSDGVISATRQDIGIDNLTVTAFFVLETFNAIWTNEDKISVIRVIDEDEYEFNLTDSLSYGEKFSFKIEPNAEYSLSHFSIDCAGADLVYEDGIYTIPEVTSVFSITTNGLEINKYSVNFIEVNGITYLFEADSNHDITHGNDFTFSIQVADTYNSSNFTVVANGEPLTLVNNTYTIRDISDFQTVTVLDVETNFCKVDFDADGGYSVPFAYYKAGERLNKLPTTMKNDCLFMGWRLSGESELFNETTPYLVENNITFVAVYKEATNLTYVAGIPFIQSPDENGEVVIPDIHQGQKVTQLRLNHAIEEGTKRIVMGNAIESISGPVHEKIRATLEEIVFSEKITTIERFTFQDCVNLKSVSINADMTSLEGYAFSGCTSLTQVNIKSVKRIKENAFYGCTALTTINVGNKVELIGDNAFANTSISSFTFPETLTSIGVCAFLNTSTAEANFPSSLNFIGENAFANCNSLTSIELLDCNCTIGDYAFGWCQGISSVEITGNVTFGEGIFINCQNITSATVSVLSKELFLGCISLQTVTVTNEITEFPDEVFYNCRRLSTINYPTTSMVEKIGKKAFQNVGKNEDNTVAVCFDLTIYGNCLSLIDDDAFNYSCLEHLEINTNADLTIGKRAFTYTVQLLDFKIPATTVKIDDEAFTVHQLFNGNFQLPSKLKYIGKMAFNQCKLKKVIFPETIEFIDDYAFSYFNSWSSTTFTFVFLGENIPSIGLDTFTQYENHTIEIKVPASKVEDFKLDENFSVYSNFISSVSTSDTQYTVKYYSATDVLYAQQAYYLDSYIQNLLITKDNYNFVGWSATGNLDNLFDFTTATINDNINLFAVWSVKDYYINYVLNGGENSNLNPTSYNVENIATFVSPAKTGYSFGGWYNNSNFDGNPITATQLGVAENLTLYAKFSVNTYLVAFSTDGGTAVESQHIMFNNLAQTPINPTKEGFVFEYWKVVGETLPFDFETQITENTNLIAVWHTDLFTVTFDCNGGTFNGNEIVGTDFYYDSEIILITPTRTGYDFVGWKYNDGTLVLQNAKMPANNITFTAFWQKKQFTISFDSNGGNNVPNKNVTYDEIYGELPTPQKTGYTFIGWKLNEEFIVSSSKVTIENNTTLITEWQENTYKVRFEPYGADGEAYEQNFTYSQQNALLPLSFENAGYTFQFWHANFPISENFDNQEVIQSLTAENNAIIVLYASWTANNYTIVFNGGENSTGSMDNISCTYGYGYVLTVNTFQKTGYTFGGWSYNGKTYDNGVGVSCLTTENNAIVTLSAIWIANYAQINFDTQGGINIYSHIGYYGEEINLPTAEQTGYDFVGWFTSATGGTGFASPYTLGESVTMYAHYTPKIFSVTFYCNEESCELDEEETFSQNHIHATYQINYGSSYTMPATPQGSATSVFLHWATADGKVLSFDEDTVKDNIKFYAVWDSIPVAISQISSFYNNNILEQTSDSFAILSAETSVTFNVENKKYYAGYRLDGYYLDANYLVPLTFPYAVTETTIIYAHYSKATQNLDCTACHGVAILTLTENTTEEVVIPDIIQYLTAGHYEYPYVVTFDANNYEFSGLKLGTNVVNIYNLSGYTGTNITFNKDINFIDIATLKDAVNLQNINIDSYITNNSNISKYCTEYGILYSQNKDNLVLYPKNKDAINYELPGSVTKIGEYALSNTNLTQISESQILEINDFAFSGCLNLAFDFNSYNGSPISDNAFENCNITEITISMANHQFGLSQIFKNRIPSCVKTINLVGSGELTSQMLLESEHVTDIYLDGFSIIGENAFTGFSNLKTVTYSAQTNITEIKNNAFNGLTKLETFALPTNLVKIGDSAFKNTSALNYTTLPENLTTLGNSAFYGSKYVQSITSFDTTGITLGSNSLYNAPLVTLTTDIDSYNIFNILGSNILSTLTTLNYNGQSTPTFTDFTKLKNITLGENVKFVTANSFKNTMIEEFTFNGDIVVLRNGFADCKQLTSINVAGKLILAEGAFENCEKLASISASQIVASRTGTAPFAGTSVKTATISLDYNNLNDLFGDSYSSITTLTVNVGDGTIVYNALKNSSVNTLLISEGILEIGQSAFENCGNLKNIIIPKSVTRLGSNVLKNTPIENLSVSAKFTYSNIFGNTDRQNLLTLNILNDNETEIQNNAFQNISSLKNVVIPANIKTLGICAFENCQNLINLTASSLEIVKTSALQNTSISSFDFSKVSHIGTDAFSGTLFTQIYLPLNCTLEYGALFDVEINTLKLGNTSLKLNEITNSTVLNKVYINSGVTTLPKEIFKNVNTLTSVVLPETLQVIEDSAFENCIGLTKVYIPTSVREIGSRAFYGCASLYEAKIPFSVLSVGAYAYANCERLERAEIKATLTSIEEGLFSGCLSLSSVNIPSSVQVIKDYAFYYNTKLITLELPAGLTEIGNYVFYNATVLENLTFTANISKIGEKAFYACASFTEIVLPSALTQIGDYAFAMCIKAVTVKVSNSVKVVGESIFENNTQLVNLTIPSQVTLVNLFGTEENFPPLLSEIKFSKGNRVIAPMALANLIRISKVIVEDGVIEIGEKAFYNCQGLNEIILPDSIVDIGKLAFYQTSINQINLTSSLVNIGEGAFQWCKLLSSVNIPNSLYEIPEDAFYGCSSLSTVTFEENSKVNSIGDYAFMRCLSLTSISIPESVVVIGDWSFSECVNLSNATFMSNAKIAVIGHYAFKDCTSLTSFVLPVSVYSLGYGVFIDCANLSSFTLKVGRALDTEDNVADLSLDTLGMFIFKGTKITDVTKITFDGTFIAVEENNEQAIFTKYFLREEGLV